MYRIIKKEVLAPGLNRFDVEAPLIASSARAGQFIILRLDEWGERIPLTIADFDPAQGTVTIIFQEVGKSTQLLGQLAEGEYIRDFVGPLGQPSLIRQWGRVVMVGGGVGIAPIHPIAREMKRAGNEVISVLGARSRQFLILEEEMHRASTEVLITTDDGSYGRKGFVTEVLQELIEQRSSLDLVISIGPLGMMQAVCQVTQAAGIETRVSMNPIMVDGTGMCGACRVQVGTETRFACVDGPEFDGHLVDWALARQRAQMFIVEEKQALESHGADAKGGNCACHCPTRKT